MIIFDLFEDNNNNPQDLVEGVNDGWFTQGSFIAAKKPAGREAFRILKQPEVIKSLEGNLQGKAGDYVITGPNGEEYLNSPEKFLQLKTDNGDGTASPKAIPKQVKLADHDGVLNTSWGDLQYTAGNDYIIRHGTGDYGAVKKDIFPKTYDVIKEEDLDEINRRGFLGLMGAGLGAAALAGLPDVAQARNGGIDLNRAKPKINPEAKCRLCGVPYKNHFVFDPPGDPTGQITSANRHPGRRNNPRDLEADFPDLYQDSSSTVPVAKSTSATPPVIKPSKVGRGVYSMNLPDGTEALMYVGRPEAKMTKSLKAMLNGKPVTVFLTVDGREGVIPPESMQEGVDLINMTDLQFYKELLAVLLIPVTALGVSAWNKVMNSLRLYRAEEIVQALQKKGITVDRDTFDQIKPLLQQLEQAIDVNNDGDAAKELAQRIQQTVSWGKLKQPTANSQSPATARDQQGVTEAEGPGRVDPILYKALARMTKGGYDDAKIALAIEFGLLDMKHNYAIANNYIPKLVDLYNQKHGVAEGQYEIHHLDPEGRRKAIYHHGKGYTDDVVRKDTQYHQKQNPRDTFRVFKDKQPFDWQGVEEGKKRKKKKASKSLGRYFFPGYGYYGSGESGEGGGDGGGGESVNPGVAEAIREKGALKAAQDAAKFIVRNLDDRNALRNYSAHFWSPEKFYQGATMAMRPGISVDDIAKAIKQDRPAQFEGVGDKRTDPAPSKEFVSNKFYVKFTPTGIEFYRRGKLVHTKSGDYSNPTRGDYGIAKGITARLWEKEYQQGVDEGAPISGDGGAVDNFKQQMANNTEVAYQANLKKAGVAESLEDYERYQYIVTLKSGKRIRFLCSADCDVKTYIERKYKEPVIDIKNQGIVGEPPVELLPGEIKEGSQSFHNGMQVKLTPEYADRPDEVFTVSHCDQERGRCWIGDEQGRGWYASFDQLIPVEDDEDELNELAPTQKQPSEQEGKINAELRKLRAQYPDARSDLEAVAIGGQEAHADARQHLARVDAIVSKLDRAADQLQSVNTDQDSELNVLDRENNDLEQKVKDLEKRIGQLKQPKSKDQPTQARSTEPQDEPAARAEPAKAKDKPNPEPVKTSNIDPDELPPARKAELKQKATQVLQDPEKFGKDTAAPMARDISARLRKSSSARDNISPDEMAMIQKMVADASKYKEPYRPSAKEVAKAAEKTKTQADLFRQHNDMAKGEPVTEVSPEYIERYKKEHGRRATAADQAGDYAKGHEHFKKINQLTKQQFQRGAKPEKVDEISNFMTQPTEPVSPEEQWKRRIRLLAKQYQTNASSLAALARENGPDSAEAVAYEYLRDPSKIRVPGTSAPASAVNWDEVIRRLPMGLSGMALLQAAEEYLINNKGMLRSTVRSLLNNDENQRSLSAAYAKKNTTSESVTEELDNDKVGTAIAQRIMVGRKDLLLKYGPRRVMQAVEYIADRVGLVNKISDNNMSRLVSQVEQVLGGMTEAKATSTRLDPKCWTGKKIGNPKTKVKGGVRVNNCVPK